LSVTTNPGGSWVDPMNSTPQFLNGTMHALRQQQSLEIVLENFETPYANQSRHYSSPMVLYQPGLDHNAIEDGRSDMVSYRRTINGMNEADEECSVSGRRPIKRLCASE